MKIARIDGSNIGEILEHKTLFPKTSFPKAGPDSDWLAANSCAEVVSLPYNSATQKSESVTPYLLDGKVHTRRVTDMTADERAKVVTASNNHMASFNRSDRNSRLAKCDWVVTKALESGGSVPSDWATYRTALRNITTHANWPNLVSPDLDGSGGDWPVEPS